MLVRYRYRSFPLTVPWVLSDVFVLLALLFSAAAVGFDIWLTVHKIRGDIDLLIFMERTLQVLLPFLPF